MWPWGHAALGYLFGRASLPVEDSRGLPLLALLFGTQFPDLVDKPFAWSISVLPTGRSFAHSALTFVLVVGIVWWVCRRYEIDAYAVSFGIGYASHLLGDSLTSLAVLDLQSLSFLLWPLLASPTYETDPTFSAHVANLQLTPSLWLEFLLVAVALLVAIATEYTTRQ